jgi:hypothetical protein
MALLGERHRVAIHFLNAPKDACYREAYAPATRTKGVAAILKALGPRSGQFLDYFDDRRFSGDDFLDSDHLSYEGAVKLMQDLAQQWAPPRG